MRTFTWIGLLSAVALVGCNGNLYFNDDEGAPRSDGSALAAHPDGLSLPYATGTRVGIEIGNLGKQDPTGWQVVSDDPSVFSIDLVQVEDSDTPGEKILHADCTAVKEGQASIRLLDASGSELREATVSVRTPDRARILAQAPLRQLGRDATAVEASAAEVSEARVAQQSTGVFGVAYYAGDQRVYGRGILRADAPAGLTAEDQTTSGVAVNEWLFLHTESPGTFDIKLSADGVALGTLPAVVVPPNAVTSLRLLEERQQGDRNTGDQVWVVSDARDAMDRAVYGLYCDWTLDGVPQLDQNGKTEDAPGDLYRYHYDPAASRTLAASCGAQAASITIPASDGYVERTTYLGCSTAPGRPGGGAAGLVAAAALLAAGLLRRRHARVTAVPA